MLRGKIMVENGRMVGTQGTGQLIPRKIDSAMLTRPRLLVLRTALPRQFGGAWYAHTA